MQIDYIILNCSGKSLYLFVNIPIHFINVWNWSPWEHEPRRGQLIPTLDSSINSSRSCEKEIGRRIGTAKLN